MSAPSHRHLGLRSLVRRLVTATALGCALAGGASAQTTVGSSLPADFPVILDASLQTPLFGFGAAGAVTRTPVVFVHGNNDTSQPTACNPFYGHMQRFAQYLADHGYAASELWGVSYQGPQCDRLSPVDQTVRSSVGHTATANVDDLRRFVQAVLAYTGADEVDIVGHSLGVIVAREWLRQDRLAHQQVRKLVAIDGPNKGIINCSPSPLNFWQLPSLGGFVPASAVCQELGSPDTPFLQRLNREDHGHDGDKGQASEKPKGSVQTLVIRNADTSFVYFPTQDGVLPGVPAIDAYGAATDFSLSADIKGAQRLDLVGQGIYDPVLFTTHLGILNSPQTWAATLAFLSAPPR